MRSLREVWAVWTPWLYLQAKCYNFGMWQVREALHESVTIFVCNKCVKRCMKVLQYLYVASA